MMPSEEIEALAPYVVEESNDAKKQRGPGEGFEAPKGGKGKQSWSVGGGSQPTGFHDMHNTPLTNVCVIIFQGEHSVQLLGLLRSLLLFVCPIGFVVAPNEYTFVGDP